jgi:hypothetical protein
LIEKLRLLSNFSFDVLNFGAEFLTLLAENGIKPFLFLADVAAKIS